MELFIFLNFIMSGIALWYRHDDNKSRRMREELGKLKYTEPVQKGEMWLCRSRLYPLLTGEGRTSRDARNDLYVKYRKFKNGQKR